jgi:hypothetical protein
MYLILFLPISHPVFIFTFYFHLTEVTRSKRNIYQFGLMIYCETKRWASVYLGYGCWCGLGGKGTPIDQTDK